MPTIVAMDEIETAPIRNRYPRDQMEIVSRPITQ